MALLTRVNILALAAPTSQTWAKRSPLIACNAKRVITAQQVLQVKICCAKQDISAKQALRAMTNTRAPKALIPGHTRLCSRQRSVSLALWAIIARQAQSSLSGAAPARIIQTLVQALSRIASTALPAIRVRYPARAVQMGLAQLVTIAQRELLSRVKTRVLQAPTVTGTI
jgi:hypothetical protein